jgi:hypothetical protein
VVNNVHGCRDTGTARSSEEHESGAPVAPMSKKIPQKRHQNQKAEKKKKRKCIVSREGKVGGGGEEEKVGTYASIKKAAQPPCKLPSGLSMSKNGVGLGQNLTSG